MPHRPESVPPLTPEQVAAIFGDPEFEARSRRDTRLANDLFDRLREVRGIVASAPLDPCDGERARAALDDFERSLFELLRYHGT